jgi:glycosyltransferase involved in cell wall biosynthesis
LKILYVIDSLSFGGAQRQLVELIKGIDRSKFEVHLCCLINDPAGYTDIVEKLDISIKYYSRRYTFDVRPIFYIFQYIREMKIDLIHSFLTLGALFGVIAAKFAGRPVICSGIRDAKDQSITHGIYKHIESAIADILVSNSMAGFTNRFKGMKPHFRVIYNGIDLNRFRVRSTDVSSVERELGISGFSHVVGMVAALSDYKDHETLLDAAPIVLGRYPNTCFLLVGDGSNRSRLLRKVQSRGLEQNVIFTGYRSDVECIYPLMDVSVLLARSSLHLEGISNAVLESMASGVPVIASAGGGTNEVIDHGRNGLVVPPGSSKRLAECIIDILSNPQKVRAMAKMAQQDVTTRFSLDRYVEQHVSLYNHVYRKRL